MAQRNVSRQASSDENNLSINPLQPSEIPHAIALWQQVNLTQPSIDPQADAVCALNSPTGTILAARITSNSSCTLVGTIMVCHDGHRGWAYYLAVSPEVQKRGIGEKLMRAAEEWLRPNVPKVMLLVGEDNEAAMGFYARCGYERSSSVVFQRRLDGDES